MHPLASVGFAVMLIIAPFVARAQVDTTPIIVHVDSNASNVARDVTRQILSRVPGANILELEGDGFPANGIGFRGLNPTQNISGDLYGYNETSYSPPTELIDDVQIVRGVSSLALGPQFGGAINYVLKHGTPDTPPAVEVQQSVGSFGLFDTFGAVGGGTGPFTYYAALQHRDENGFRPNADYDQTDAYAQLGARLSPSTNVSVDFTRFRNRIHMPGGLTDSAFNANPDASYRSRNWLATPRNILEANLDSRLSDHVHLYLTSSAMFAQRYLVWLSEFSGPQVMDTIEPTTNQYAPREVDRDKVYHVESEARLAIDHRLFDRQNSLAVGVSEFSGTMRRQTGGVGSTGTDFDMSVQGSYPTDLHFGMTDVALFAEDMLHVTDRWTLTPGVRGEWLQSAISGVANGSPTALTPQATDRTFVLGGVGTEYHFGPAATVYANWSEAYRPITYDLLTPFASAASISPNLKDSRGYDVDVGWRGTLMRGLGGSVTGYYQVYNNREGLMSAIDSTRGLTFTEESTIGNSAAKGVETSVTISPFVMLGVSGPLAGLAFFDAAAYDDAHYITGPFKGNYVELAPRWIHRAGLTYGYGPASTTFQVATQTRSYTDANNTVLSPDNSDIGVIPGYTVLDWSIALLIAKHFRATLGINNLGDERYFTDRSVDYPGAGILPSPGRSLTFGVSYLTR